MITPQELNQRVTQGRENLRDLFPIVEECEYISSTAAGSHDMLHWQGPQGSQYYYLTAASRSQLIKELKGAEKYFISTCDEELRHENMTFLLNKYAEDNRSLLVRTRAEGEGEDRRLITRAVFAADRTMFDYPMIVRAMQQSLEEYGFRISEPHISDEEFSFYAILPEAREFTIGDWRYVAGFIVESSEIGSRDFTIWPAVFNLTHNGPIYWPFDDMAGPAIHIGRNDPRHAATLTRELERIPAAINELADSIEERLRQLGIQEYHANQVRMQTYAMMAKGKISNPGDKVQQITSFLGFYTNDWNTHLTRLMIVQAIARTGVQDSNQKLLELAGRVATDDSMWREYTQLLFEATPIQETTNDNDGTERGTS